MKIVRIDEVNKTERVVATVSDWGKAAEKLVQLAQQEADKMPNSPHVVPSGYGQLSVSIGVYNMVTFRLE